MHWHEFLWVQPIQGSPSFLNLQRYSCLLTLLTSALGKEECLLDPTCTAFFILVAAGWGKWQLRSCLYPADTTLVRNQSTSGFYQVRNQRSVPLSALSLPPKHTVLEGKSEPHMVTPGKGQTIMSPLALRYHLAGELQYMPVFMEWAFSHDARKLYG